MRLEPDVRRLMRRFEASPEKRITAAMCKLIAAVEADEISGSAAAAVLGRHGEGLLKAGGTMAVHVALEAVCAVCPDRAAARRTRITPAWAALLETKP